MEEYHLLANQESPEGKETSCHGKGGNDDPEHDNYGNSLRFKAERFSSLRDLWSKHSLVMVLALSITANLLFGILSFTLLKTFKAPTTMQTSLPDFRTTVSTQFLRFVYEYRIACWSWP